jgi:hypothetical protein
MSRQRLSIALYGPPIFNEGVGSLLRGTPWIESIVTEDTLEGDEVDVHLIFSLDDEKERLVLLRKIPPNRCLLFIDSVMPYGDLLKKCEESGFDVFLSIKDDEYVIKKGIMASMSKAKYKSPYLTNEKIICNNR